MQAAAKKAKRAEQEVAAAEDSYVAERTEQDREEEEQRIKSAWVPVGAVQVRRSLETARRFHSGLQMRKALACCRPHARAPPVRPRRAEAKAAEMVLEQVRKHALYYKKDYDRVKEVGQRGPISGMLCSSGN